MKRQCSNCKNWTPTIDNGYCDIDKSKCYEYDDCCKNHKRLSYFDKLFKKYRRS